MENNKAKLTELGSALGLKPALEISDDDVDFPEGEGHAGLENGSPVDPSSASTATFRHSATFGKLCQALCKASLEFPEIKKDTKNPYFGSDYADLAALIKATRAPLAKQGLFVIQPPATTEKGVRVTTMLMHTSEEWFACDLEMPSAKVDAQGKGGAITYARRYSYQAILNIAGEEDDDGNTAVGRTQQDRRSEERRVGKECRSRWSPYH